MCIYSCKGVCIFITHTLLHVRMYLDHGYVPVCVLSFIPLGNCLSLCPSYYLPRLQHLFFCPCSYK